MKLKTLTTAITLMATFNQALPVKAQQMNFDDPVRKLLYIRNDNDEQQRIDQIHQQMESRKAKLSDMDLREFADDYTYWTDGRWLFGLYLEDSEPGQPDHFVLAPIYDNANNADTHIYTFSIPGKKTLPPKGSPMPRLTSPDGLTLSAAKAGLWQLLILRDAKGNAQQLFTHMTDRNEFYDPPYTIPTRDMHDVYDGHYQASGGRHLFFGPRKLYAYESYDRDPGLFNGLPQATPPYTDVITYGEGRVSRGNPKSPNYGKMPGGGGAGAIMGGMAWMLKPTRDGMQLHLEHDEPFVDHDPAIRDGEKITHLESPYGADVPGQWAFASVRPVGRGMLARFPKGVLRLMRNEIYARHGHRFQSAPDVQQFFDEKPWYKPTNSPTPLSPIEQLNVGIIKAEEAARAKAALDELGRLESLEYNYQGMRRNYYDDISISRDDSGAPVIKCNMMGQERSAKVDEALINALCDVIDEHNLLALSPSYTLKLINGERILDGFHWRFAARFTKKKVDSSGSNAWPSEGDGLNAIGRLLQEAAEKAFGSVE